MLNLLVTSWHHSKDRTGRIWSGVKNWRLTGAGFVSGSGMNFSDFAHLCHALSGATLPRLVIFH